MTRRVLIITAGGTPQVITETLYALAMPQAPEKPWWPDEIVLMATAEGDALYREGNHKRRIVPLLGADGKLRRLINDLDQPEPALRVQVARHRSSGAKITDIRSAEEVGAFADEFLAEVRRQTADDTELHVSLAGGRKTMSYLAGAILSLCGRPQDRLSHVLIEPAVLEGVPAFWWPGQSDPAEGFEKEIGHWSVAGARALLHTVPFVRLRAHIDLEKVLGGKGASFAKAVELANQALTPGILRVDTQSMSISAGGGDVVIKEARQFAIYRLFAEARMNRWVIAGKEPGAMRFADILAKKTPDGMPLIQRLGDILHDVWLRGMKADVFRADSERDSLVSLEARAAEEKKAQESSGPTSTEIIEGRIGPQVSDLRRLLRAKLPAAAAKRAVPSGRGMVVIPWDPDQIEIT